MLATRGCIRTLALAAVRLSSAGRTASGAHSSTGKKGFCLSKMGKRNKAFREAREKQKRVIAAYRRRHRQWTMEVMPTMSHEHWEKYLEWVAEFGSKASTRTRKLKRQLTTARDTAHGFNSKGQLVPYGAVSGRTSSLSHTTRATIDTAAKATKMHQDIEQLLVYGRLFIPGKRS